MILGGAAVTTSIRQPRGVHLVGSVPLPDAQQVFRMAGTILGRHVRRIPDGETGERTAWAAFQLPMLARNPAFQSRGMPVMRLMLRGYAHSRLVRRLVNTLVTRLEVQSRARSSMLRVRPGVRAEDIRLGPLGYAAAARDSYVVFEQLKQSGVIPALARLQVCLPTPIAVVNAFPIDQQLLVLPAYEARLVDELREMLATIPAHQLAIQWDAAIEFAILEGVAPSAYGAPSEARAPLLETMLRLGNQVPPEVELGYHLCYGDAGHRHFTEPKDTTKLVDVANALAARLIRPLGWVHFPVPIGRFDDAYYAPLRALTVAPETEVYAGVVHAADGAAGTRRRIEAAQRAMDREFGIATECGLGRRDPKSVPSLLRLHAELAAPLSQPSPV
jgi:hypothetical protein